MAFCHVDIFYQDYPPLRLAFGSEICLIVTEAVFYVCDSNFGVVAFPREPVGGGAQNLSDSEHINKKNNLSTAP